jgi:poly(hydroxyalkanoate) granule-associated protein
MMANKLKGLAGAMSETQLAATVRESAQQIWLAGLGAYSTAQKEGNKVFKALVKEGKVIQALTQKAAEARLKQAAARATGARRRLEQVLEDSVARSLKRFGVPTREGVDTLSKRVVELTALVDKLTTEARRKRSPAKPAAGRR